MDWCLVVEGSILMRQLAIVISVYKSDCFIVLCIFALALFFHWIKFSTYPECLFSFFKSKLAAFHGCFPSPCTDHFAFLLSNLFVFPQLSEGRDCMFCLLPFFQLAHIRCSIKIFSTYEFNSMSIRIPVNDFLKEF